MERLWRDDLHPTTIRTNGINLLLISSAAQLSQNFAVIARPARVPGRRDVLCDGAKLFQFSVPNKEVLLGVVGCQHHLGSVVGQ
jgi:hypothetical protein